MASDLVTLAEYPLDDIWMSDRCRAEDEEGCLGRFLIEQLENRFHRFRYLVIIVILRKVGSKEWQQVLISPPVFEIETYRIHLQSLLG